MFPSATDRSYTGTETHETHTDGKPMPSLAVSRMNAQIKMAAKIRRLIKVRKMNVVEACKVAGVHRSWYYDNKSLIERPPLQPAA